MLACKLINQQGRYRWGVSSRCSLLQTIIALIGVSLLIFLLVRASGDPTNLMHSSTTTEADIQHIRVVLGLDKSLPVQYWIFVKGMVRGDFGFSYIKLQPVTSMIAEALPYSLKLGISAFVVAMILSLIFGVVAATRHVANGVQVVGELRHQVAGAVFGIITRRKAQQVTGTSRYANRIRRRGRCR